MSFEFFVENKKDGKISEISELVTSISYSDPLNNGCGKLEFSYLDDELDIYNGSVIRFRYQGTNIFYGYVFKNSRSKAKKVPIVAYDQLRYLKAKDIMVIQNMEVADIITRACLYFNLRKGNVTPTGYKLPTSVQDNKTWLDVIYEAIRDTLLATSRKYCLRDEFGYIALRNLEELKLNLILGEGSLCYDFNYEKSIDTNTYNLIKLIKKNEESGRVDVYIAKDSDSFSKWGILQYYEEEDKSSNDATIKSKADALLKLYNRELETLELKCLGDTRVRAGTSVLAELSDIGVNKRLIVKNVTHHFLPVHTMEVELCI
ncbi:hypothetical protein CS063_01560 [Sporanaerobium hydrogeniformans]|uniref:Uncharacterized protein n=1 Tax=Sporanaerobium hydrogeniformans TaxID=3072179 RepID=A0AC61DHC9_9FIRM|nr:hypothetical protein [Sporanaerobium hydrogeniformans]PHV72188.1 hypothetical protein CS063_01560 [Sporanaerobium hydrogeniformans]